jgi:hypothetical protein
MKQELEPAHLRAVHKPHTLERHARLDRASHYRTVESLIVRFPLFPKNRDRLWEGRAKGCTYYMAVYKTRAGTCTFKGRA